MAQLCTQTITISLTKLLKNGAEETQLTTADFPLVLEGLVEELLGDSSVVVEVQLHSEE